ncbi:MAG TPA: hypothetical protein VEH04_03175 [Verrucomicrobiae bacterium]|nr:hypothetical protein [Verrucomicrobiae bacterium]
MSRLKKTWAATLLGLALLPCHGQLPFLATNTPALRVEMRAGETVGAEQIHRAFISLGTNKLVLRVPGGFQLDAADPDRVVVSNLELGQYISIQLVPRSQAGDAPARDAWKQRALRLGQNPTIVEELTEYALNRSGPGFDLRWMQSGAEQRARVVYIPTSSGTLEISLFASAAQFDRARLFLRIVLASMQTDEHGPIVITPLPDFS